MTRSQQSMQQRQNLGDTAHNASVCVSLNMSKRRTIINHAHATFRPVTRGLPVTQRGAHGSAVAKGRLSSRSQAQMTHATVFSSFLRRVSRWVRAEKRESVFTPNARKKRMWLTDNYSRSDAAQ